MSAVQHSSTYSIHLIYIFLALFFIFPDEQARLMLLKALRTMLNPATMTCSAHSHRLRKILLLPPSAFHPLLCLFLYEYIGKYALSAFISSTTITYYLFCRFFLYTYNNIFFNVTFIPCTNFEVCVASHTKEETNTTMVFTLLF